MKRIILLLLLILAVSVLGRVEYWPGRMTIPITTSATADSSYARATVELDKYNGNKVRSIIIKAKIYAAKATAHGFGGSDTSTFVLKTLRGDSLVVLDSTKVNAIPASWQKTVSMAVGDTVLGEKLFLTVRGADTTSDTVLTTQYDVDYWLKVVE